jgi:2-polyprenyl-3-methyl-5-hydroxy-6-metoxy-1,4-benzoquinol methylase
VLTPARRRGIEILDDPNVDPAVRQRSIDDVTRSNRILGGLRAAVQAVQDVVAGPETLLDIGTGLADIPARVKQKTRGVIVIGVDEAASLLVAAGGRLDAAVCANALALPFRSQSIDIVMCSQVLHHFEEENALRLLGEMDRVAKRAVVVSDLRRSWLAAAGFWLVSFPLRFHPVTRHDGVVSVLRGFTRDELRDLVHRATGQTPHVRRHLGFRLTARWTPRAAA